MRVIQEFDIDTAAAILKNDGVVVLRTDTLYGVLACARSEKAVQKVYELKGRDETKSPIVLISDRSQVFDPVDDQVNELLESVWPGKVSVIIPSTESPTWIRRDNQSVAYRLPAITELQSLIAKTGPLIAPSANPEGLQPADSIEQAVDYFGENVDLYIDGGVVEGSAPSQIVRINNDGIIERLR